MVYFFKSKTAPLKTVYLQSTRDWPAFRVGIWDQLHMRKWRKSHTQHHFTLLKNFSVLALSFQNAGIICAFKMHYEY